MRRLFLSLLAASAAIASLVGVNTGTAGAEGIVDLSADVTSAPTVVSPVGGRVVYSVVFRNEGATSVLADLEDATTGGTYLASGSTIPTGCDGPADGAADPVVTCTNLLLAPAQEVRLYVAILTPTVTSTVVNTAEAALSPVPAPLIDAVPTNNSDTVTTQVKNDPATSSSYLRQGDSLTFKTHTVTVRKSDTGVIVRLADAFGAGRTCGDALCADGLLIDFPLNDVYSASDIEVDLNFGKGASCRSISNASCVDALYYVGPDGGAPELVPACTSAPADAPTPVPCVRSMYKSPAGQLHIVVGMDSEDPELLPQGLKLTS